MPLIRWVQVWGWSRKREPGKWMPRPRRAGRGRGRREALLFVAGRETRRCLCTCTNQPIYPRGRSRGCKTISLLWTNRCLGACANLQSSGSPGGGVWGARAWSATKTTTLPNPAFPCYSPGQKRNWEGGGEIQTGATSFPKENSWLQWGNRPGGGVSR